MKEILNLLQLGRSEDRDEVEDLVTSTWLLSPSLAGPSDVDGPWSATADQLQAWG